MSEAPETVEYVLQAIESDKGSMPVSNEGDPLVVDVSVTDLADGLTIIAVPEGLHHDAIVRLSDAIRERAKDEAGQFIIVEGDISKWRFARLVRKDKWDRDYGEPG